MQMNSHLHAHSHTHTHARTYTYTLTHLSLQNSTNIPGLNPTPRLISHLPHNSAPPQLLLVIPVSAPIPSPMKRGVSSRMERSRSSSQSSTLARVLNLSLPSALMHDPAVPGGRGVRLSALLSDLCCAAVAECHSHVCVRVRVHVRVRVSGACACACACAWVHEWVHGCVGG